MENGSNLSKEEYTGNYHRRLQETARDTTICGSIGSATDIAELYLLKRLVQQGGAVEQPSKEGHTARK